MALPHLALPGAVPLVAAAGAHELGTRLVAALALGVVAAVSLLRAAAVAVARGGLQGREEVREVREM